MIAACNSGLDVCFLGFDACDLGVNARDELRSECHVVGRISSCENHTILGFPLEYSGRICYNPDFDWILILVVPFIQMVSCVLQDHESSLCCCILLLYTE